MINFWYNGSNFNAVAGADSFCLGRIGFLSAKRDVRTEIIPGANMPLTIDNGRWETTNGTYQCFIQSGYGDKKHEIELWLSSGGGSFHRLEDTEEPQYYRMAKLLAPIDEKRVLHNDVARFDVSFELSAERWLKSGEDAVEFTESGVLVNPTTHTALPLIIVNGTGVGTLTINNKTITISEIGGKLTMDSATQRAYNDNNEPKDDVITGGYHTLGNGENVVSFGGGVTSVKITPRWWTI